MTPGSLAGIPVLTVTTTGARTGQRRTVPLLGVPAGDDIAVIGTSFGQPRTPGWYHNMRADPKVEVTYRDRTVKAIAREADDRERQVIWDRARTIYAGYQAYASRIKNREIHIMILSTGELRYRAFPANVGAAARRHNARAPGTCRNGPSRSASAPPTPPGRPPDSSS